MGKCLRKYIDYFSKCNKLWWIIGVILPFGALYAQNSPLSANYLSYIENYYEVAILHQQEYGIPASITLAQGLLESGAGRSRLATEGNNHFGIKCHKSWTGEGIYEDDDEAQECFRKYPTADLSFEDHARFLKRQRYSSLFDLKVTDYKSWAKGLSSCGYATDPNYPTKLINIIEKYELYLYDTGQEIRATRKEIQGDETLEHDIDNAILQEVINTHNIKRKWGLHYIVAHEGDSYEMIANEFGIKTKKLLSFNDLNKNNIAPYPGEIIYLQEKEDITPSTTSTHEVKEGETLLYLSQKYGIKLKKLLLLNDLSQNENLAVGSQIILK